MPLISERWGDRFRRMLGTPIERDLTPYRGRLARIQELESELKGIPDSDLSRRARDLRDRAGPRADPAEREAALFALVKEAARRTLGLVMYDEQLIAGLAMSDGRVAEMQTGEGKTLAAVAPVALHAMQGAGAHVLTFNDYLAARDARWMGPLYRMLGLQVAHVEQGMTAAQRRQAYASDVTYVTAREAGFDFLRDGILLEFEEKVQRPFAFALADEADSLLIDEARIPLVIAAQVDGRTSDDERLVSAIRELVAGRDFETDDQRRNIALTDEGAARLEEALGCGNLYDAHNHDVLVDLRNALHAEYLLQRDVDYIVRDGRIELVDDFTGRVAERRQWPDGLQAAVEAKERVTRKRDGRVLGSITVQHLVTNYTRLCGMTGTASAAAEELHATYGLGVVVIPTHVPCRRRDEPDVVFTHVEAKRRAVVAEITRVHASRRPVLVGTASVRESEELAAELARSGVPLQVLNAKNDAVEAEIVARAASLEAVTISTNMAGRGTDIRLGGPEETERDEVAALGGLYVIATNRHASLRVDLQLRGRCGRQGDPGTTRFFVSLEDSLIETYGVRRLIPARHLPPPQDEPIDDRVVSHEIARAQRIIEGTSFDIRQRLLRYSRLVDEQRRSVQGWREAVRDGADPLGLLAEACPAGWEALLARFGTARAHRLERRLTLLAIDRCWSDYLAYVTEVRDSIHVVNLVGKDPLTEFSREVGAAFARLEDRVAEEVVARFEVLSLSGEDIDWEQAALLGPSSTWTYLVNDDPFGASPLRDLLNRPALSFAVAANVFLALLLAIWALLLRWSRWRTRRRARRAKERTSTPDAPDAEESGTRRRMEAPAARERLGPS